MENMNKIRAQYMARRGSSVTVGGYELFDIYLILRILLSCHINGTQGIRIPFMWINKVGGFDAVFADQVEHLSDLLVMERIPGDVRGLIVAGLTKKGVQFLKKHVKELMNDLPAFSLTEEAIMNVDISNGGAANEQ